MSSFCVDDSGGCDGGDMKTMNVNYFWDLVRENEKTRTRSLNLIFEKYIHLNDECESVIVIGMSPPKKLTISARIEVGATAGVLRLDEGSLIDLLQCVDERFGQNAVHPKHRNVNIKQLFDERFFRIETDNGHIKLCLYALLALYRKRSLIMMLIKALERKQYERSLFKLLHHFCYDAGDRSVAVALRSYEPTMHKQCITDELCMLNCKCLEESFTLEIALNCLNWFTACVPLFIKSLMQTQTQGQ